VNSFGSEEIRIYIQITTNSKVEFFLAGERVEMQEGICWFLDVRLSHRVVNHGDESQTHIVIDAQRNDWFAKQLSIVSPV